MTAFGAFVKKTEIDFCELNQQSLFLITGPTGSGKTTILDAITFALFGEASGDARQTENFKSDYCDLTELCSVELEFELKGKKFKVERYPKQKKKSLRNGNIISINSKAKLTLDDGSEIIGVENVNQKIVELFGMTSKQFKQIVILPQGEFKKLLEAKSEEKQEIFRKIFDTDLYERFTKVLIEKTKEIENKINTAKLLMDSYINTIEISEDEKLQKIVMEILSDKTQNKSSNMNLLVLELKNNIQAKKLKIQAKKEAIDRLEKERDKIKQQFLLVNVMEEKQKKEKELEARLKNREDLARNYDVNLENIKKEKDIVAKIKAKIPELIYKKNRLENYLGFLEDIKMLEKEYQLNKGREREIEREIEEKTLMQRKICLLEEINEDNILLQKLKELVASIEVYHEIYLDYQTVEREYLINYEKFLLGQAGFLAQKLETNMPCPVCGSLSHPQKAKLLKDTPSEEYVNDLSENAKKLRDKIASLDVKMAGLFNFVNDKIKNISMVKYEEIMSNRSILQDVLMQYRDKIISKNKECQNISVDIEGKTIDSVQNDIKKLNEIKIRLEMRMLGISEKIKEYQLKLDDNISENLIKEKVRKIDNKIIDINNNYEAYEQKYMELKSDSDKNRQEIKMIKDEILRIKNEINDKKLNASEVNIEEFKMKLSYIEKEMQNLREEYMNLISIENINNKQYESIKNMLAKYKVLYREYSNYADLSEVANGKNPQRISFERYILASYFQDVIDEANIKFSQMTGYRYLLKRKEDKEKNNRASGLDLEIIDNYTGKARHVNTLSGGEAFKASLCLALGLAQVVQMYAGGIEIDTLFIDEGFGTLDLESLDVTIEALNMIKKTGRLIGIISHVNELKERISAKLIINATKFGSSLRLKVD